MIVRNTYLEFISVTVFDVCVDTFPGMPSEKVGVLIVLASPSSEAYMGSLY